MAQTGTGVRRVKADAREDLTSIREHRSSPSVRLTRNEVFHKDNLPSAAQPTDYERKTGKAILPSEFSHWVASKDNWLHGLVTTDASQRVRVVKIESPTQGAVYQLDPDLPDGGSRLQLTTTPALEGIRWRCSTLRIESSGDQPYLLLEPGHHSVSAEIDGMTTTVDFQVQQPGDEAKNAPRGGVVTTPP